MLLACPFAGIIISKFCNGSGGSFSFISERYLIPKFFHGKGLGSKDCGCSSVGRAHLAKVAVVGSSPITRSSRSFFGVSASLNGKKFGLEAKFCYFGDCSRLSANGFLFVPEGRGGPGREEGRIFLSTYLFAPFPCFYA